MSTLVNHHLLLASRPTGEPTPDNFRLVQMPVPDLADGQVLVRHHDLSLDPSMRERMDTSKSCAAAQPLDPVMISGTAGEVAVSEPPLQGRRQGGRPTRLAGGHEAFIGLLKGRNSGKQLVKLI